jgi:NDP-sugar pyrophosphorylase family protein
MTATSLQETDAVILCGGLGTRLAQTIKDRPKPMAEIEGRPFLDLIIDYLYASGVRRFILCSGYKSEFIERYYQNETDSDRTYTFSVEAMPLGTAGAVKNAESHIKSDPFFVLNGDSFCNVPLNTFYNFHVEKKAVLSAALTRIDNAGDYGSITLNADQKITSFDEKSAQSAGRVNAGIYLFSKSVLNNIEANKKLSLEYDTFPKYAKKGMYGFSVEEPLYDIGTPDRLEAAKKYFSER